MKKLLLLLALVLSCGLASFAETVTLTTDFLGMSGNSYKDYTKVDATSGLTFKVHAAVNGGIALNNNKAAYIVVSENKENVTITSITFNMNTKGNKYVYKVMKNDSPFTLPSAGTASGTATLNGTEVAEISKTTNSDGGKFEVNDSYVGLYQVSGNMCSFSSIVIAYEANTAGAKDPAGLEYAETEFSVELGEEFTAPKLTNPNDLAVTYDSSDKTVATVDAEGKVTVLAVGTTTITATSAETETYKKGEASYKLTVTRPIPEGAIVEELTAADFAITSNYKDYTWTSSVTGIKYVAHAYSESGEYFQLRTKNSQSGIVVTQNDNGYLLSNIEVEWVVSGMAGTTLDVYVNDEAYSAPSALFSSATQGNKVGSIVKAENAPLSLNADKKFVGIRSNNGAVQLSKITLVWEKPAAPVAPAAPVVTMGEKTVTVTVEEGCTAYYKFVVVNDQPAIETFALEADTWYPVENNTIDLTKLPMTSGNEKLQLTVKAVNADNVESEVYTTEPFANPGGTTGIAEIELGEEAPAEYYNLQGVRMDGELTPGLYIRRQGNKATKVIVK